MVYLHHKVGLDSGYTCSHNHSMGYAPALIEKVITENGTDYDYLANKQLKLAGSILEYKVYGRHFSLHPNTAIRGSKIGQKKVSQNLSTERVYYRARRSICDYVNSNVGAYTSDTGRPYRSLFVTLTFRENITDFDTTHPLFSEFIRSLSYDYFRTTNNTIKYVAVPEFQSRGAVHYHCIFFNLPFRYGVKSIFSSHWKHGFVQVKSIDRVRNVGVYISKYLSKSFLEKGLSFRKSYFVSKGLHKPLKVCYDELIHQVLAEVPPETLEVSRTGLKLDFLVSLDYFRYNLRGRDELVNRARSIMSQV